MRRRRVRPSCRPPGLVATVVNEAGAGLVLTDAAGAAPAAEQDLLGVEFSIVALFEHLTIDAQATYLESSILDDEPQSLRPQGLGE